MATRRQYDRNPRLVVLERVQKAVVELRYLTNAWRIGRGLVEEDGLRRRRRPDEYIENDPLSWHTLADGLEKVRQQLFHLWVYCTTEAEKAERRRGGQQPPA